MFNSVLDYKKSKKTLEEACKLWKERLIKMFDPCVDFNVSIRIDGKREGLIDSKASVLTYIIYIDKDYKGEYPNDMDESLWSSIIFYYRAFLQEALMVSLPYFESVLTYNASKLNPNIIVKGGHTIAINKAAEKCTGIFAEAAQRAITDQQADAGMKCIQAISKEDKRLKDQIISYCSPTNKFMKNKYNPMFKEFLVKNIHLFDYKKLRDGEFDDNIIEIFNAAVEESKIYVKDLLTKDDVKSVLNRIKENWTINKKMLKECDSTHSLKEVKEHLKYFTLPTKTRANASYIIALAYKVFSNGINYGVINEYYRLKKE